MYQIGNLFEFTGRSKTHFWGFLYYLVQKLMYPAVPTFEINGHGASVHGQFDDMHITRKPQNKLPNR